MYTIKTFHRRIILIFISIFVLFSYLPKSFASENTPQVYAPACILMETSTGKILYSKNANEQRYPASTTKVMTAILTLENCNLTDLATVSHNAIFSVPSGYSNANLQEGEELTIEQLLNVLLIPSANDAAFVLAEHIAGSVDAFSDMMNKKAEQIGCKNTHFVNPNGIHSQDHYSTAYDLALIGKYAMQFDTFKQIITTTTYKLPVTNKYDKEDRIFSNTNELIKPSSKYFYEYSTGGKTGYTDAAKNCIITTAKKDDMELIVVILNDENTDGISTRPVDCKTLFEYGFNNYTLTTIVAKDTVEKNINVENASQDTKNLDLIVENDVSALIPVDYDVSNLEANVIINDNIKAPISQGDVLGSVTFYIDNVSYSSNLIASHSVKEYSIIKTLIELILIILFLMLFSKFLKHTRNKKNVNKKSRNSKSNSKYINNFYPKYK